MVNIDSELCICELNVKWDFQPSLQGNILDPVKDFYICPVLWYWLKTTTVVI